MSDGGMTSLGGDGEPIPGWHPTVLGNTESPVRNRGGCVMSEPFVDLTVTMGPFQFSDQTTGLPSNWSDCNPRCLKRDLKNLGYQFTNQNMIDLALEQPEIGAMTEFTNSGVAAGEQLGAHGGGHFAVGPLMFDTFASPFDSAFYVHHAMLDKLWLEWQEIGPAGREFQYNIWHEHHLEW